MIEILPFWEDPEFDPEKRELIKSEMMGEFSLLMDFPHYVGSHDIYNSHWHFTPETYTYTLSDGSREEFELQSPDLRPSGDLILEVIATENYVKRFFNVQKIREELFLVSYVSVDYSWLESLNEDSEIDGDFEFHGEDWAETAPEESLFYYENQKRIAREEAIRNSEFKDVYEDAVNKRNRKVDEIGFDRTHPDIYLSLQAQLPDYKSTMSQTPSIKTGQPFTRYFLFDHVSKKDQSQIFIAEPITTSDIGIWVAGMLKDKTHSFRNQPVAFIKPNGRILWESRKERYLYGLEVISILQELLGEQDSVINKEKLDLVIYDSRGDSEGNIFMIRSSSKDLATNIVKTMDSKFGIISSQLKLVLEPDSGIYKGSTEKLVINLYEKPNHDFVAEFLRVRDDLAI
jgi:hypothetical protein